MPLSSPVAREHLHTRAIICEGFRRDDGLWDIEAHMTDTKTYGFDNRHRGQIDAGEPVHDMWLRLTLDDDLVVHGVEAATDAAPFGICPEITPQFAKLEGLRIGPGWSGQVKQLLGGTAGCTHLVELLRPLATTAVQTIHSRRETRRREAAPRKRPGHIDTCHALRSDGAVVKEHWPEFYTGQ